MSRMIIAAAGVLVLPALAACGADEPTTFVPPTISCTAQMRPTAGSTGAEEVVSFSLTQVGALGEPGRSVETGPFHVDVSFVGEAPEGHTVRIEVSTTAGEPLVADLFQYGGTDALATEFAGGHGFTGLRYVYDGDAELQYFCAAAGADGDATG